MVILATLAAVIASQAVISGAFSVTRQAVSLGFLPRLRILHTSSRQIGQVYVPVVNWGIYVAVLALVVGFGTSTATSHRRTASPSPARWQSTRSSSSSSSGCCGTGRYWLAVAGAAAFLVVDLGFFAANVPKILHGGWFPLVIATLAFTTLMTWRAGRMLVYQRIETSELPVDDFIASLRADPPVRVRGTAIFLTSTGPVAPRALIHNVRAQPRPARPRRPAHGRHRGTADRSRRGTAVHRGPRSRHHADRAPPRIPGGTRHPWRACRRTGGRTGHRRRGRLLLPQSGHDRSGQRARPCAVAQGPLHDTQPQRQRRGRVLPDSRRPRRRDRDTRRTLRSATGDGATGLAY